MFGFLFPNTVEFASISIEDSGIQNNKGPVLLSHWRAIPEEQVQQVCVTLRYLLKTEQILLLHC